MALSGFPCSRDHKALDQRWIVIADARPVHPRRDGPFLQGVVGRRAQ
jgi:hypothetical protein